MPSITEEMRVREKMCIYAQKYGVTKAARRYQTNRQFIYRQLAKYDGTKQSLAFQSRKPHRHPNQHQEKELILLRKMYRRFGFEGHAEVYAQTLKRGYERSFGGMKRVIRDLTKPAPPKKRTWKRNNQGPKQTKSFPGELVQVDIKYVPKECILWKSHQKSYYQITAIDTFSSKRILQIVDEKSMTNTVRFIQTLEEKMACKIHAIQTDNGAEFTKVTPGATGLTSFEQVLFDKGITYLKTRPYSPWQNGIVERSHRIDGERFYHRQKFRSLEELIRKNQRYQNRYNNIAKQKHHFQSPNQVMKAYFQQLHSNMVS